MEDHVEALRLVLDKGRNGRTYNIGGNNEQKNIDVVRMICRILDEMKPDPEGSYERLIEFVKDRPGHDRRYAINSNRMLEELGWRAKWKFRDGLEVACERHF